MRSAYDPRRLLLWTLLTLASLGRAAIVTADLRADRELRTLPGRVVTASWVIRNPTDRTQQIREHLILPAGWQVINADDGAVTLPAGGSALRLVAVRVPLQASVGPHAVKAEWFDASAVGDRLPCGGLSVTVTVEPRDKLEAIVQSSPGLAIGGDTYEVAILAVNRGNQTVTIKVSGAISPLANLSFKPEKFSLAPGASQAVSVKVATPPNWPRHEIETLQVQLAPSIGTAADLTVQTDVIPPMARDASAQITARLETTVVREADGKIDWRGQLSGTTALNEAGTKNLTYLIRGPDTKESPLFLEPGQLSVNYSTPSALWRVGDENFGLSPLTARDGFSRGVGFDTAATGALHFGGYSSNARYDSEDRSVTGAYGSYDVTPDLNVRMNLMEKEIGPLQTFHGERAGTASISTAYDPAGIFHATAELGYTPFRPAGATQGQPLAALVSVGGTKPGVITYRASWESYGSSYFGALRDAQSWNLAVEVPLTPVAAFRAEAQQVDYTDPHSLPLQLLVSNREATASAGVICRKVFGMDYSIDAQQADRTFAFAAEPTRYREKTIRFGAGRNFRTFGVQTYVDVGELEASAPTARTAAVQRVGGTLFWQPTSTTNLSLYLSEGNDPYSPVASRTTTIGASASASIGQHLTISGQGGENLYDTLVAKRRSYLFSNVSYALPDHQRISLRAGWFQKGSFGEGGTTVALSYARDLSIPHSQAGRHGAITGEVIDDQTSKPVRRAVVSLGDSRAVTDAKGHFAFDDLKAGSYQLRLDSRSLHDGQEPTILLPFAISLDRNEKRTVRVPIATTGAVQFQLTASDDSNYLVHTDAVLVELIGSGRTLRQLTDARGRAVFPHVIPGKWTVHVDPATLPAHCRVTAGHPTLQVASLATNHVDLVLSYQAPAIRWLASAN